MPLTSRLAIVLFVVALTLTGGAIRGIPLPLTVVLAAVLAGAAMMGLWTGDLIVKGKRPPSGRR